MALTSTSTVADALAQYNNNLNWEADATTAQNALEAVRFLLANRPAALASGLGQNINYTQLEKIHEQLAARTAGLGQASQRSFTQGRPLTW